MTEEEKRRRKACPNKELTQLPSRYLTGYEGSQCVRLNPEMGKPFKWKQKGIDTDEFRKQCEDIDKGES